MNESTKKLTTGAMFTAIFALIILLNRQTAGFFQEFIMYILPIPMVGFSSRYGWKSSLPVLAAMTLISVIFGMPTGIFYAVAEAGIGLVLGSCVYAKKDMTRTLLTVMGLSALANVLDTIVLATLFGYDLIRDMLETQEMTLNMMQQYGMDSQMLSMMENMLTAEFMMQMILLSMILMGLLQGFLVFMISLLILRRLGFHVPKPQSVFSFYPPRWTAAVAMLLFFGYPLLYEMKAFEEIKAIIQMIGLCGYLYLICFGYLAVMLLCRKYLTRHKIVGVLLGMLGFLMMPFAEMILGIVYISTDFHQRWMEG